VSGKEREDLYNVYDTYFSEIIFPTYGYDPTSWPEDTRDKFPTYRKLERVRRCDGNLLEFSIEYFSDARNPENDGNWDGFDVTCVEEAPEFHVEITDIMNVVSTETVNAKIAAAAPRSHAKSTYLSKAFPVSEILYRRRRYLIIISETPNVSKANMEWIRNQLKYNRKLREDFGPLLSPKDQSNIVDNSEEFIAWHPVGDSRKQLALVQAASTGQALRGRNWNGTRPDLIVCDDLEDARPGGNASTSEQRSKLRDWFAQTVMPLGDPKGKRTAFVMMGTTVHYEALLMSVLHSNPDFESKIYRAIIDMPERSDLWEELRLIYTQRENPDRKADADKFYTDNEAELLKGSRVLWPEVQPLYKLMRWKWTYGSKAFNTEYMNNPIDEESMIFNPETFTYYTPFELKMSDYFISMGVDFAFGKENGDFSAITVVARHKENGIVYVIDSFLERMLIDKFFEVVVEKVKRWQPDVIAADANAAQEFLAKQLTKRLIQENYPATTRLKEIKNRTKKELRIEAMKPDIENGTIRFNRQHERLLEQFERYDGRGGYHDDGPDSMVGAITEAVKSSKRKAGNAGSYRY
jgi:predicted phage terminase large subunit-like protein